MSNPLSPHSLYNPYQIEEGAPEIEERGPTLVERPVAGKALPDPAPIPLNPQPAQQQVQAIQVEEHYERPKQKLIEWPELLIHDYSKIKLKILYGTDLARAQSADDYKVAIFCCNVPSNFFISGLGILSAVILLLIAVINMDKYIVLYETIPWLLSFGLTVSVILSMWLKLPKLLKPFRIFCAVSRVFLLTVLLVSTLFIIISAAAVIVHAIFIKGRLSDTTAPKFFNLVMILAVSGTFYLLLGMIASAATRCDLFLRNQNRR